MSPPAAPPLRKFLLLLYALMLLGSAAYVGRNAWGWIGNLRRGETPFDSFLRECRARIPEDATVCILADEYSLQAGTALYPRPNRLCRNRMEALEAARTDPNAWVVSYPSPFDPSRSFAIRARDLH